MGFEIPLDCDYPEHPKAIKIVALLGKRADVFPLRLFCWAAKFAKTGVINGGPSQIEAACRWDGKSGVLHAALVESGILESDGVTIHDWMDHAGRKLASYEKKKAANKDAYRKKSSNFQTDESGIKPECQTDSSRGVSINETKRNETRINETKRNETPPAAFTIAELAQKATFKQGKGTSPNRMADWHKHIEDLQKLGFSLEFIDAEIDRKDRMSTEPPWEFLKRLVANSSKIAEKTPEQLREERIAADNERARQLREKRKAQNV